jgi:MFS family permease
MAMLDDPPLYFCIFGILNLFNFIDRGIIPGAADEFTNFVDDTVNTGTPSLFVGLLQSAFIVGFCLASPIFGTLCSTYSPFVLVSAGMTVWIFSAIVCWASYYLNSFEVLLIGRVLSGIGEASIACCVPPWIGVNSDPGSKSRWLSMFYTALPIGTAFGYIFSAVVASEIGWQYAYLIEAIVVSPMVIFLWVVSPRFPHLPTGVSHFSKTKSVGDGDGGGEATGGASSSGGDGDTAGGGDMKQRLLSGDSEAELAVETLVDPFDAPSYWDQIYSLRNHYCYLCIILGYAALNAVLIGIATFGSSFLMAIGYFNDEVDSSSTLGAIISVAGLVGFPLGGLAVDYMKKRDAKQNAGNRELLWACGIMVLASVAGSICFWLLYVVQPKIGYLTVLAIGLLFLFVFNSAITLAILYSLPIELQSIGIACAMVVSHLLGDVPSPLIVGYLKDILASGCTGDDDEVSTSSECRDDEQGIRLTMLLTALWLFWCIFFSGLALYFSKLKCVNNKKTIS